MRRNLTTRPTPTPARRGFTLADLLAVVGCAGFALALLVPFLSRSAAAAKRVGCQNNLKQIGLATANYEGMHRAFPSGPAAVAGGGAPLSWKARLLPFLDMGRAAEGLDFSKPLSAGQNVKLSNLGLSIGNCPSDRGAGGSYAGVRHHEDTPPAPTDTGVLRVGAPVRSGMVTDGLAHTLLCGEKRDAGVFGGWAALGPGSVRTGHAPPGDDAAFGFAGHHGSAGGAYFAICDGAVRWVPAATDDDVFARLCRFADGALQPRWGVMR